MLSRPLPLDATEAFALARAGAYCELVDRVNATASPGNDLSVLHVFGLLCTGDLDLAIVQLSLLYSKAAQSATTFRDIEYWIRAYRPARIRLVELEAGVDAFYAGWNEKTFLALVMRLVAHRELEFVAAVLEEPSASFRLLVAIADALKLRGEVECAYNIYINMCRANRTPALVHNVCSLAMLVDPAAIPIHVKEFSG